MAFAWIGAVAILAILATGCRQFLGLESPSLAADAQQDSAPPDADPNAPVCTILSPITGTSIAYDATVALTASAIDPQDGTLPDASITWHTDLKTPPLGTGRMLTTQLPVGANVVSCVATDATSLTGVAMITVVSQSPFPTITHPTDGQTRPKNQSIPFNGDARDLEDGTLAGAALAWMSSIDGALGMGTTVNATLSEGVHVVTLAATDSNGNTYATAINLTIQ